VTEIRIVPIFGSWKLLLMGEEQKGTFWDDKNALPYLRGCSTVTSVCKNPSKATSKVFVFYSM
jgi:hypothetical protein